MVQFSALHCLINILMTFVMYHAFWNLRYLQIIQILFTVMTAQLHYVKLLILNYKSKMHGLTSINYHLTSKRQTI